MGNRRLRRLPYLGAMGIITARRRKEPAEDWQWRLLPRKIAKQAAIALANRMARTVRVLLRNGTEHDAARAAGEPRC
jgi:transposase